MARNKWRRNGCDEIVAPKRRDPSCITIYLVRIWTYKIADKKAHTFSRRSKNVKKTEKNE